MHLLRSHINKYVIIFITTLWHTFVAQYTPTTYPDPRSDPLGCKIVLPGQLCDPSEILLPEERRNLIDKISRVYLLFLK